MNNENLSITMAMALLTASALLQNLSDVPAGIHPQNKLAEQVMATALFGGDDRYDTVSNNGKRRKRYEFA